MYQPPAFVVSDLEKLHALILARPLALIITNGPDGLIVDPIPFLLDPTRGPNGTLRAHLARANPQLKALAEVNEVMVVFQEANAYISPSHYATKREHHRVVPTWNYSIVQVWGKPQVMDDKPWIHTQVENLTDRQEAGRAEKWKVSDAPDAFVDAQMKGIVGLEIPISRIEGKFKLSQNRTPADQQGVIDGLSASGDTEAQAVAAQMAKAISAAK
jgi:transcriptional regulator